MLGIGRFGKFSDRHNVNSGKFEIFGECLQKIWEFISDFWEDFTYLHTVLLKQCLLELPSPRVLLGGVRTKYRDFVTYLVSPHTVDCLPVNAHAKNMFSRDVNVSGVKL